MKTTATKFLQLILLLVLVLSMSACEAIGSIFEAGVWVGAVIVFMVVAVVWFIARKVGQRT